MQLTYADYMKQQAVNNFRSSWDEMGEDTEVKGDYDLGAVDGGVKGTVDAMIEHLGMFVAEGTDLVAENARSHSILLSGVLCGGHAVLMKISFGLDKTGSMAMKVVSRAESQEVSELLHEIVQDA